MSMSQVLSVDFSAWDKTAKRLRPPAQGCRFGYPGIMNEKDYPTAKRLCHFVELRHFVEKKTGATALRLGPKPFPTQGSRSGNPGLEDATALRLRINLESHRSTRWLEVQP